jgi:hypothetical protein
MKSVSLKDAVSLNKPVLVKVLLDENTRLRVSTLDAGIVFDRLIKNDFENSSDLDPDLVVEKAAVSDKKRVSSQGPDSRKPPELRKTLDLDHRLEEEKPLVLVNKTVPLPFCVVEKP